MGHHESHDPVHCRLAIRNRRGGSHVAALPSASLRVADHPLCQDPSVNLILIEPDEVDGSGETTLADERATHALGVLRVVPGQSIRIGLVDGPLGVGIVTAVAKRSLTMRCAFETESPARPGVDLLLALPRPKVMRRLWPQLAAIGVGRILLTNAERVERNYFDTHVLEAVHYRPLLIDGLQQARDTRLPLVSIHRQFKVLIEDQLDTLVDDGPRLVADPSASADFDDVARRSVPRRVLLAVGPEGGWNAFELEMLGRHGFVPVGMGPRTLRSDTACIALLTLAHRLLREEPHGH